MRNLSAWGMPTVVGLALLGLLAGCALRVQNREVVQEERQRLARPSGSAYVGWRVFQDRCAGCHGEAATGTTKGPDLLPRLREMGPRRFVDLVLRRYDWGLPPDQAAKDGAAREALIEQQLAGQGFALQMPACQGEPSVSAHIADLYVYLAARAEGAQGPGRPAR